MLHTVDELFGADAVSIVVIGRGAAARGDACKLSAMHPIQVGICFCAVVIGQGITTCVIIQQIDCVANLDGCQQICPLAFVATQGTGLSLRASERGVAISCRRYRF